MIAEFCTWLSSTRFSMAIQDISWIVPGIQSVHILAIATVMASIVMLDFRLLGVTGRGQSIREVAHRFLPWIWSAVAVLLATGILLIIGEPARELINPVFWVKMSLLAVALILTGTLQYSVFHHESLWERRRALGRILALASLLLWMAIVTAGRWIAYVEHG